MSTTTAATPHLVITDLQGKTTTVLMSFGLLNKLSAMLGDLKSLPDIYLVPELQDTILYEILIPRDEFGTPSQPYRLFQFADQLSPDQGQMIIEWVEAHLYDFFLKRLRLAQGLQTRAIQQMMKA